MSADDERTEPSEILRAASDGGPREQAHLAELLQAELRELAGRAMASERDDHTLQPTALVHEVWLKLFAPDQPAFSDHRHYLAVASQVMRQILVDHARARRRVKRGGHWDRVQLEAAEGALEPASRESLDLVALDEALEELRALAPRQVRVVELRFFAGLSVEETAEVLEVSERTAAREWRFARAWLAERLEAE